MCVYNFPFWTFFCLILLFPSRLPPWSCWNLRSSSRVRCIPAGVYMCVSAVDRGGWRRERQRECDAERLHRLSMCWLSPLQSVCSSPLLHNLHSGARASPAPGDPGNGVYEGKYPTTCELSKASWDRQSLFGMLCILWFSISNSPFLILRAILNLATSYTLHNL